jgi:hypothetical protein
LYDIVYDYVLHNRALSYFGHLRSIHLLYSFFSLLSFSYGGISFSSGYGRGRGVMGGTRLAFLLAGLGSSDLRALLGGLYRFISV